MIGAVPNFCKRLKHKPSQVHARMGDLQPWGVQNNRSVKQEVQIHRSWGMDVRALSPMRLLNDLEVLEQCFRRQHGFKTDRRVEKRSRVATIHRRGFVKVADLVAAT